MESCQPFSPRVVVDEVLLEESPLPLGLLPRHHDRLPRRHLRVDVVTEGARRTLAEEIDR